MTSEIANPLGLQSTVVMGGSALGVVVSLVLQSTVLPCLPCPPCLPCISYRHGAAAAYVHLNSVGRRPVLPSTAGDRSPPSALLLPQTKLYRCIQ